MISFRRWGYRMIGATADERAALVRARYCPSHVYIGDAAPLLNLSTSPPACPPGYHWEATPAGPIQGIAGCVKNPVRKVLGLHLGAKVSPVAPVVAPPTSDAAAAPAPAPDAPACPPAGYSTGALVGAGAGGAALGGLLMYFVGLATREKKKRARR
jgi:hypothetical protein